MDVQDITEKKTVSLKTSLVAPLPFPGRPDLFSYVAVEGSRDGHRTDASWFDGHQLMPMGS